MANKRIEQRRKDTRERYYWLKEHHVCTKCGGAEALPGKTLCKACNDKVLQRYHSNEAYRQKSIARSRARVERFMELGVCIHCGEPVCEGSKRYCAKHLERARVTQKRWRAKVGLNNEKITG